MIKNKINTIIILTFFSVFGYAHSNISNEGNLNIDKSYDKVVNNLMYRLHSENTIWADTAEIAKNKRAKKKKYKAWVTLINRTDKVKGFLYAVNDSSIVVSASSDLVTDQYTASLNNSLAIANIKKIRLRKKGNIGRGYIIGTSIGIVAGILLASGEGDGFTTFAVAGMMGIVGSVVGTGVGGLSGTKRYTIDGNQEKFLKYRQELKTLSLVGE